MGDATTTSPWVAVDLAFYPYLPKGKRTVNWSFGTDPPSSYDVASFTVEYRHYVPVG